MTHDYAVTVKVRNNRLLSKMRECGYQTTADLSRATKISQSVIGHYLLLKTIPLSKKHHGKWNKSINTLSNHFKCLPEDLFPAVHIHTALSKNTTEFTADATDFQQISASLRAMALPADEKMMIAESSQALTKLLNNLTPRERNVIDQRFGLIDGKEHIFSDIPGEKVSLERVRQVYAKAIRKLRHGAITNKTLDTLKP